jgi:hypothetical protein
MYAREPSTAGVRAAQRFRAVSPTTVVELGAGHGATHRCGRAFGASFASAYLACDDANITKGT